MQDCWTPEANQVRQQGSWSTNGQLQPVRLPVRHFMDKLRNGVPESWVGNPPGLIDLEGRDSYAFEPSASVEEPTEIACTLWMGRHTLQ
jgi:hypothetical protein